jgi:ATP-dependent exoDNAse (exonuclease V) beta subunit
VPVDYNQKQMAGTIYEHDYHQEHLQNTVDNLNLLYVAFTRAGHHLFVIGRRGARNSRSTIIEQTLPLLTETLSGATLDGLDSDASPLTFEYGSLASSSRPASQDKPTTNPFLKPVIPTPIHITTFSNKVTFRQSNQSQDFIAGDDEEATRSYIHTGSVLHKVFSSIRTSADVDAALRQLELAGILYDDHNSLDKITHMLRKRLAHPKVASWFSDRWTLFNECAILTYEDGHITERRPDRVMTDGQEWIVVDFKFGSPKSEYHDQVREYMDLIRKMNGPLTSVKGYLWFVYSNQIEEV